MVGLYFGDVRHLCFLLLDVRRFERWSFWTALGVLSLALSLITGTLYVVLGLGPWSLVVLKDKIAVLGPGLGLECLVLDPGLELQVLGWVILSQQASSTMVWARVYLTWNTVRPASKNRVLFQSGLFMRPNRACMSNCLLETLVFLKCNSSVCV